MSAYSMLLGGYIAAGAAEPDELCMLGDQLREWFSGSEGGDLPIGTRGPRSISLATWRLTVRNGRPSASAIRRPET